MTSLGMIAGSRGEGTFEIDDCVDGDTQQLLDLLVSTQRQFPDSDVLCRYDDAVRQRLDELVAAGVLTWQDVGNPHSKYARVRLTARR